MSCAGLDWRLVHATETCCELFDSDSVTVRRGAECESWQLTSLLLHRWEAEDVGVRCSRRSLRAPHIHSVYDLPSLVSLTTLIPPFFINHHHHHRPTSKSIIPPPYLPAHLEVNAPPSDPHAIVSVPSVSPPSCRPPLRAAATVPRCIALSRPKSQTGTTGRRSGWARTRTR